MQLEAVRRVPMGDLRLKVGRQIDDVDCIERALLRTDTTSYAQSFGDESNLGFRSDLDTELAGAYHRA